MRKLAIPIFVFLTLATTTFASPVDLARICMAATANGQWGLNDEVACVKVWDQTDPHSVGPVHLSADRELTEDVALGEYVRVLAALRRGARFGLDGIAHLVVAPDLMVPDQSPFTSDAPPWTDSAAAQANVVTTPEPAALLLLGTGMGIVAGIARRRRSHARNADGRRP